MGDGFEEFFSRYDWDWKSADEYRNRHQINAVTLLQALLKRGV